MQLLKLLFKIAITILGLFAIFTNNQETVLNIFIITTIVYLILDSSMDLKESKKK